MTRDARVPHQQAMGTTPKKLHIKTFGCQMNAYDSERMAEALADHGYTPTDEFGRGRSRHSQYLPHPREGGREGLFRAWPRTRGEAGAESTRPRHHDRGGRLRGAGRRKRDPRACASCRSRGRAAKLSRAPGAARPRARWRRARGRHGLSRRRQIPLAAGAADRPRAALSLHHRAGRLRQVLHVLRGALHARRRIFAPCRGDPRRGREACEVGRARAHPARAECERLSRAWP